MNTGDIYANRQSYQGKTFENTKTIAGKTITVDASSITRNKGTIAGDSLNVTSSQMINSGNIQVNRQSYQGKTFENTKTITGTSVNVDVNSTACNKGSITSTSLSMYAPHFTNDGTIKGSNQTYRGRTFRNNGTMLGDRVHIYSTSASTGYGSLLQANSLNLSSGSFYNNGTTDAGDLSLSASSLHNNGILVGRNSSWVSTTSFSDSPWAYTSFNNLSLYHGSPTFFTQGYFSASNAYMGGVENFYSTGTCLLQDSNLTFSNFLTNRLLLDNTHVTFRDNFANWGGIIHVGGSSGLHEGEMVTLPSFHPNEFVADIKTEAFSKQLNVHMSNNGIFKAVVTNPDLNGWTVLENVQPLGDFHKVLVAEKFDIPGNTYSSAFSKKPPSLVETRFRGHLTKKISFICLNLI